MSLITIEKTIELDVYDHDTTPSVIKSIQMDTGTRTVFAIIQNSRQDYDIGQNASVSLTVLRPDKTKVQITGETFISHTGTDGATYGAKAELSDVALAVKGNLKAQFKITSGEQELRTEIFAINNGEALDAVDGDWAGDLDGHNLDEMAESIETLQTDMAAVNEDVSDLKEGLDDVNIALHKVPSMTNGSGDADLYISDDAGNALAKFQDGGFQVKKFKGFDFETYRSDTKVYTGSQLTFTIGRHFDKGDRVVLHMERGEMPWAYGAYVTYKVGQTIIKDNWRGDCAWFVHTLAEDTDEISAIYPANSTFVPRSTNITFEVSLLGDVPIRPTVVTIKQDGTGDFTTLRGALDSIGTKANDVLNPYRIEIYKGTYDVLADYTDAEIRAAAYTQTDFVGPKLLNGMYLVGMGLPEEVVLTASLDPESYDNNIRGAISTLNCQGTCGMENLTVEAYNIRYCVHDDYHTQLHNKPKRTVKNCVFRGYGVSYTPGTTYGAGTSPTGCDYEFINCDFGENAGVHTMPTTQFRSLIHLINCTGGGFRIGDNATTDVTVTGYDVFRFDGCGFPWIRNNVDGSVPHAIVKGSGNRPPMYQLAVNTLYETDDVTVVPNVNLAFTGGVGTVVEWFSDSAHGPRFRIATSAKTAVGVVVYQDSDNTYIQTRGYVCTDRANVTAFALGDYVGVSNGQAVIVTDDGDAFGKIKFVDASGFGYIALKGA